MGWTKRQFIQEAFTEIGMGPSQYDPTPEELRSALRRLDAMIAEWIASGIRLSYPLPESPDASSLDVDTTVPDFANDAIITNLAIRIAPSYGKQLPNETRVSARMGINAILNKTVLQPPQMQMPSQMPTGAGGKGWRYNNPFVRPPADPIQVGPDGPLEFD